MTRGAASTARPRPVVLHAALALAVLTILGLALASTAVANTYKPTRLDDPTPSGCKKHDCSLREAVIAANHHAGTDKIVLEGGKTYNLRLNGTGEDLSKTGDLDILDSVTITHTGSQRATVDAHKIDRVFQIPTGSTASATLSGLVIQDGKPFVESGGGIQVEDGSLKLVKSSVTGNTATYSGGGIRINAGSVSLRRSSVVDNRVTNEGGGGIELAGGSLKIVESAVSGNVADQEDGGGIEADMGSLKIVKSTVAGNRTKGFHGGGFYTDVPTVLRGSTVSGNRAAHEGGGIFNDSFNSGGLTMRNDTVADNKAVGSGGGIAMDGGYTVGTVGLNDVTIARNEANSNGLGGGDGGGIFQAKGTFTVANSLIALNTDHASADPNCLGTFVSSGHNLRTTADPDCSGFSGPVDLVNPTPRIGQLADNGGPTKTIALMRHSPAIGKADPATSEKRDQRGVKRDSKPDIGAYERG